MALAESVWTTKATKRAESTRLAKNAKGGRGKEDEVRRGGKGELEAGVANHIQRPEGAFSVHGPTPPFDREGFRVYNIVLVGPVRRPDRPSQTQISQSKGDSAHGRVSV